MKLIIAIMLISFSTFAQKSTNQAFNPKIGVNALFLSQSSEVDKDEDGMRLQEAEIQMSSDVDAYFTARVLLAIEKEPGDANYVIEPEEAVLETLSIPHFTVKVGKSKLPMGKQNQLHSHAYPFINPPLQNTIILGEEGLSETGLGISGLIPLPWFSELSVDYTQGENEKLFNSPAPSSKAVIGHFKNLWDLSASMTLELGLSSATGKNSADKDTQLLGADLTFKWRPTEGGKYNSFEWSTEYLEKDKKEASSEDKLSGVTSFLKYQMSQRWWVQYRYDYLGLNKNKTITPQKKNTALIAFLPSEFSGVRLQYETIDTGFEKDENRISLQLIMSIGAHPAHSY